jgi:hypothetical protein
MKLPMFVSVRDGLALRLRYRDAIAKLSKPANDNSNSARKSKDAGNPTLDRKTGKHQGQGYRACETLSGKSSEGPASGGDGWVEL